MAETVETRFRRMEQYLEGLVGELEALQAEMPGFGYEIRNIGMKTNEVQRNIQHLRRKAGPPPGGGAEPATQEPGVESSRDAGEMARELHQFLTHCKEYMVQMEEVDPAFASYRTDLRILMNQAQDRLQQYWERETRDRSEPFIKPLNGAEDPNQEGAYQFPPFMRMTKGLGKV